MMAPIEPRSQVVRRKPHSDKSRLFGQARLVLATGLGIALFVAVGLFHVSTRIDVVQAGYGLSQAERRYHESVREEERLELELATLRSARRLDALAKSQLKMGPPTPAQIIALPKTAARRETAMLLPHP